MKLVARHAGVLQQLARRLRLLFGHQNAARQHAQRSFHDTHILVGDQKVDPRVAQQAFDKGDDDGVVGSQKLDHGRDVGRSGLSCKCDAVALGRGPR